MILSQTNSKSKSLDYLKFHHDNNNDQKYRKMVKVVEDVAVINGTLGDEY